MPIYEYRCEDCGAFELWRDHRRSGEGASCPECDATARRIYSAVAFKARTSAEKEASRLDRGSQPRVAARHSSGDSSPGPRKAGGRPWQISH